MIENLRKKILNRSANVSVIGLGYVGLPLAVEFAKAGFQVFGIDIDKDKVKNVNKGASYILDVDKIELGKVIKDNKLKAFSSYSVLKKADVVNICVPTPLRKTKEPNISYIIEAADQVAKYLHKGQLIILESTTYPGTTQEVVLPELEQTGLKAGKDFCLAFSPERVDPGNKEYKTKDITKVVGGVSAKCGSLAKIYYKTIIKEVVTVSSPAIAEMVKLLENTFRSVNIALVNEMLLLCDKMNIDIWEVIRGAKTKPFGFMVFYPGPGLGGHCIPIDSHYLSWKARLSGYEPRLIDLAGQINSYMPLHVVNKTGELLNNIGKSIRGSKILILGVAYKKDVSDIRESPSIEIIRELNEKGAEVSYNDPHVTKLNLGLKVFKSIKFSLNVLRAQDLVILITSHSKYDSKFIVKGAKILLDTRNFTSGLKAKNIFRL
jgi:UDP-N-acetyl-D-glucosamine dehydrogenase